MQVDSMSKVNGTNPASFEVKEKKTCFNSKDSFSITVPRSVCKNLLGMAMLAMAIFALLTSCEKDDPIPDIPVDTVAQSPAQKEMVTMLQNLGIIAVTATTKSASSSVQKGDVIEFKYRDTSMGEDYKFKINEEESDEDKLVYYGSGYNYITGGLNDLRLNVTKSENGLLVDKQVEFNGEYSNISKNEYVANADNTVDVFRCLSDGTKRNDYTFIPESPTSLVKEYSNGERWSVEDILIVQKK